MLEKNNPKLINAWCMYDWANSVFSLTIATAIFPEYFLAVTPKVIDLGFTRLDNDVLMSYVVSASFLFIAFLSPFLTAIADYSGRKKIFMQAFCYLGASGCLLLYFFKPNEGSQVVSDGVLILGCLGFSMGLMGFSGSIVFYNSFLPEITDEANYDRVSARGFSMGYIGSILLLVANIVMVTLWPGYETAAISFVTVGLWWFLFAQYTFKHLPKYSRKLNGQGNWLFNGVKELGKVLREARSNKYLLTFLLSFFFFNMGVQTVMYLAPLFAKVELKLDTQPLILTILIIQLVAVAGAIFFNKVSAKVGNTRALQVAIVFWVLICGIGYIVQPGWSFYTLASMIGFVMGGVQSLARSTYSKLIPDNTLDNASYFSFYDVSDKVSTVIGTFLFGFVKQWTGNMRISVLAVAVMFVIGGILLLRIPSRKIYKS